MAEAKPVARFKTWLAAARRAGVPLAEAGALATADRRGHPSVRFVLLKDASRGAFTFYTNSQSRKGRELAANPWASLAFYWDASGRQVRIEGRVEEVSAAASDRYWNERPRQSQLASLASRQSRVLANRAELLSEVKRLERLYKGRAVPRSARWRGYRLKAREIEFWTRHEPRLHHRELFVLKNGRWTSRILAP
ncbi:MAG: pyridoxamine 5'-phosphate oxidase [Deltaproteobacteria bacterium]